MSLRKCFARLLVVALIASQATVVLGVTSASASTIGWSAPTTIDTNPYLTSVSCASATLCVAVDSSGNAVTWTGTTWSSPVNIDSSNNLSSVSCASSIFCVAADYAGNAVTWNGSSWTVMTGVAPYSGYNYIASLSSVSCLSSAFCAAVGASGNAVTWNGTSWSSAVDIDSSNNLASVSCTTSTFCVAVDYSGNAVTWNGSSSSTFYYAVSSTGFQSVSCTSSSFCVAVGDNSDTYTWGTSWSGAISIPNVSYMGSVSCVSTSFCVAVADNGNAYTYPATNYSVTYVDSGAGSGTLPTQANEPSGATFTVASGSALTDPGYAFGGWNDGTTTYAAGSTYTMPAANVTLTAVWTPITYSVTYVDSGAGSGTLPTQANEPSGVTFTVASGSALTDPGYAFGGWNDGTTTYAAGSTYTMPAANVTLTAVWTPITYTVTFNSEGGSSVANMSGLDGTTITLPSAPTYAGYTFDGWFAAASGGSALTSPYTLAGSVTLYAQWTANIVVAPSVPINAAPPAGLPLSSYGAPTSVSTSCSVPTTLTQSAGSESVTVEVPTDALPCPTMVSVYPIINTATLVAQIPTDQSYVVSLAVSWRTQGGSIPTATSPLTMTITDPNIVAGDTIYEVTAAGLKVVGTAAKNGTATVTFSSDPTFVIAHTNLVAQAALNLTSVTGTLAKPLILTTSGGSGSGAVSYTVTNGTATGCVISGSSLDATSAGTCLVMATKAADTTYSAVSSLATTVTFRAVLRAIRMTSPVWTGRSVVTNILGAGFYGQPRVTSNVRGTRIGVEHDSGTRLTIRVIVAKSTPRGVHVFTIVFAHGQRVTVRYNQR